MIYHDNVIRTIIFPNGNELNNMYMYEYKVPWI